MKLSILLLIVTYLTFGYPQDTKWEEFVCKNGNFSILDTESEGFELISPAKEPQKIKGQVFRTNKKFGYYSVITYEFCPHFPNRALEGFSPVSSFPESNYKVKSEKNITLGQYYGKEFFLLSQDDDIAVRERVYFVGDMQYTIIVQAKKNNLYSTVINKFLNSFKLLKDPEENIQSLLSFGNTFSSSVVKVQAFDSNGAQLQQSNGFLANNKEVFALTASLYNAGNVTITTITGKTYQVKSVTAYTNCGITRLRTEDTILDTPILPIAIKLPIPEDKVIIISSYGKELGIAQFSTTESLCNHQPTPVHMIRLTTQESISRLNQNFKGSPIINNQGKVIGIVYYTTIDKEPIYTVSLYGISMDFLSSEIKVNPEKTVEEYTEKVDIE